MLVTPGTGRDQIVSMIRWCAQLQGIVAGNYVYELSEIALWGAAARGISADRISRALEAEAATPVPATIQIRIAEYIRRYGMVQLVHKDSNTTVQIRSEEMPIETILTAAKVNQPENLDELDVARLKMEAARAGWPIIDSRQVSAGAKLPVQLSPAFRLRPYQRAAVAQFLPTGNGLVLLPCGAGKTVVGVAAAAAIQRQTLILVPSQSVGHQWEQAFLTMTNIDQSCIGLISGTAEPLPVSICTYHGATASSLSGNLIDRPWGLVIYDEVQSLPADTFRLAAEFQSVRRLGLSATLVREDEQENQIFALVGPPVFDIPWIELEREGWIAPAVCTEVRLPEPRQPVDGNRYKIAILKRLLYEHRSQQVLVVSSDLKLLAQASKSLDIKSISGKTPQTTRMRLYSSFNNGDLNVLAISRVGSVGLDLPGASVMVQLSGTYGSRQEEAQRVGRLLRPAEGKQARFYSLVTEGTRELHFAQRRQRYLVLQGYQYQIRDASEFPPVPPSGG